MQDEGWQNARTLILEHGWNSTCYQILNPGIRHWFSRRADGLVGYVRSGKMLIVAGAPVCSQKHLPDMVREWERFVADQDMTTCYFGAEQRLRSVLSSSTEYSEIVLGSQPEWHPHAFLQSFRKLRSLRAQLNRAKNKDVIVTEWPRDKAENNPLLERVLTEWLSTRGLPTLHFLVEPQTLSNLRDRRIFVAEQRGEVIGFVTLCPVPARNGWLTEQFVRAPLAPNGLVELMLHTAAEAVVRTGSLYFTMGIVPLVFPAAGLSSNEPTWLRVSRRWATAHYTRFYNFRGLMEFKAKFRPTNWEPVVVIVHGQRFGLNHLRPIVHAFTVEAPEVALMKGLAKAIRTEVATITQSFFA